MEFILNEDHRNISNQDLLDDLKRVHEIIGKDYLSQKDYLLHGKYAIATYRHRFGSWVAAVEKCGYKPSYRQVISTQIGYSKQTINNDELIADVIRVSNLLGKKTISSVEYSRYGKFSKENCIWHFKTWNNTLLLAGLIPFEKVAGKKVEEEKLLEEIERVWISLGRQPTTTDIKNGCSHYSLNTYVRHYGSWRKALEAFVQWVNSENGEITPPAEESDIPAKIKPSNQAIEKTNVCEKNQLLHKTRRDINLRLRFLVMRRDNFKCCICGASPATDPSVELHIDHIIPWAKGGETTIDNLQTLCSKCNLGKSDLYMDEDF